MRTGTGRFNMIEGKEFIPLNIAVLTISDTRTEADDISGQTLVARIKEAGHAVRDKKICADNIYQIRAIVSQWIVAPEIQVIITTGGTGVTGRDGTPEAVMPLCDKLLDGFGEVFRMLSYQDIKTSTIQSRAIAGVANGTYIFALPGSSGACRTAWDLLIQAQLDARTRPCNLVQLMPRLLEK
jgi:molybdopterin adenylyltransferase